MHDMETILTSVFRQASRELCGGDKHEQQPRSLLSYITMIDSCGSLLLKFWLSLASDQTLPDILPFTLSLFRHAATFCS
jgi:hypothetical protein